MTTGKLLIQLIKTGTEGNIDAFRRVSEQVIQEKRSKKHHIIANDLEKILYGRRNNTPAPQSILNDRLPKDKGRDLPLLHLKEPIKMLEDVVLSDESSEFLHKILQEHHRSEDLLSYGLHPVDKVLFYGPPGCGKTLTAEVIASEMGLPLGIVRIDSVISSLLGETASNLRQIFDFVSTTPMVVLFDEFDAIAKERASNADHGELKRVVNAFLQMLDAYEGKSLLIAATNHESILDPAIWRRFDEVIVFDPPNREQLQRLLHVKLRGFRKAFDVKSTDIVDLFKGMSHADTERVLLRAAKEMVLTGKDLLNENHIRSAIRREETRRARVNRES